jgi:hypothetical protein
MRAITLIRREAKWERADRIKTPPKRRCSVDTFTKSIWWLNLNED